MKLKSLEISGFKSFAKKTVLTFDVPITSIVGPNGSGKSNVAEAFRFVLGEQSMKSMRGKRGEDLIFSGTAETGRLNRASVKLVFDNRDKSLPIDFEEVALERVVHRDGVNEYFMNSSPCRLKDIVEMLGHANIGSSGHHIISQGEADRILSSSTKDRKEMIEDALGLRVYQNKKIESERKLEQSTQNLEKVESLRREIAPHIKYLKKQVEKIEHAKVVKEELKSKYDVYLKNEDQYLKFKKESLDKAKKEPKEELESLEKSIPRIKAEISEQNKSEKSNTLSELEKKISDTRNRRNDIERSLGSIEGELRALKKVFAQSVSTDDVKLSLSEIDKLISGTNKDIDSVLDLNDITKIKEVLNQIKNQLSSWIEEHKDKNTSDASKNLQKEIAELETKLKEYEKDIQNISIEEKVLADDLRVIRLEIEKEKEGSMEAEKKLVYMMARRNELETEIRSIAQQLESLSVEEADFKRELTEAAVLVGREVIEFYKESSESEITELEPREKQIVLRREIEKLKIRLEEMGATNASEVMKEYETVSARDTHLAKEVEDIQVSIEKLEVLISELNETIAQKFKEGINKINDQFDHFFKLMFGGGSASLKLVKEFKRTQEEFEEEEKEFEEGIDIFVDVPRKKIKGLMMLSGGERALVSIALIFAMSQVNPPPFIILDETDAALDEANSRKYGDMIENLAKKSQLILITHNRETMSRAGIIYGVTMPSGGISRLLSIKFDEAVQVAK